ncbi:uncharacterized protein LOC131998934 isoform X2 [Mustela nigripes]|uniref:uncharacterized protein LOC131998934 isoform X2 n=1 Tax=Mustela nigripes TaxID=77151 RepID=UPI0028157074|nr:uncharacterized protein LOC131998934 isoform X2 [Mustela nigripes]
MRVPRACLEPVASVHLGLSRFPGDFCGSRMVMQGPAEKTLSRDQASDRSCSTVERLPRGEGARETYGELRLCADREKRHTETQSDVSKTFHVVEVLSNSLMSPNGMAEQPVSQARLGSCPAKAQKERSGLEVLL